MSEVRKHDPLNAPLSSKGGQIWTPMGGHYSMPIDSMSDEDIDKLKDGLRALEKAVADYGQSRENENS